MKGGQNSKTFISVYLKDPDARIVGYKCRRHKNWNATMYDLQWKIWPDDTLIYEQFSKPKVYPHYDRNNSMQISVRILMNLIENEEDF